MRHLVLVGGGHSHALVLLELAENPLPDTRLTVLVDLPIAFYSGMVPGVVAGRYRTEEVEIELAPLAKLVGAEVVLAKATHVDPVEKKIYVEDGEPVSYDLASFGIGSTVAGRDLPGVRENTLPTRPIGRFVDKVPELVERARESSGPFRMVVVGGGAGGVELAFTFLHRLRREGLRPEVTLVHSGSQILEGYPQGLVRRVREAAERDGVQIRVGTWVREVEPHGAVLESGETLPAEEVVWVVGAVSHSVFEESGLATDSRGFVWTRSTLQFRDHDELFASGDCGTLMDFPGTPKAGVYAVRQGPVLTKNFRAYLAGEALESYRPQSDFLTLINLGDGRAIGSKKGFSFMGRWVMELKDYIDRKFMRRVQLR